MTTSCPLHPLLQFLSNVHLPPVAYCTLHPPALMPMVQSNSSTCPSQLRGISLQGSQPGNKLETVPAVCQKASEGLHFCTGGINSSKLVKIYISPQNVTRSAAIIPEMMISTVHIKQRGSEIRFTYF